MLEASSFNSLQVETLKKIIELIKKEFPESEKKQRELLSQILNVQL